MSYVKLKDSKEMIQRINNMDLSLGLDYLTVSEIEYNHKLNLNLRNLTLDDIVSGDMEVSTQTFLDLAVSDMSHALLFVTGDDIKSFNKDLSHLSPLYDIGKKVSDCESTVQEIHRNLIEKSISYTIPRQSYLFFICENTKTILLKNNFGTINFHENLHDCILGYGGSISKGKNDLTIIFEDMRPSKSITLITTSAYNYK